MWAEEFMHHFGVSKMVLGNSWTERCGVSFINGCTSAGKTMGSGLDNTEI